MPARQDNAAAPAARAGAPLSRAIRVLHWSGAALVLAIAAGAALAVHLLKLKDIEEWRSNLGGSSFLLAVHTEQMLNGAQLVLESVSEKVAQAELRDASDFRDRLSTREFYVLLRDKVQVLPQLDVISLVAANGDNINFSRGYPIPKINLADRDYFAAHRDNPALGDHISASVRNKGNGNWTFYLSRRVNDAQGRFIGLILVGLSVQAITETYDQVVASLGQGAGITLVRSDGMALARSPRQDELIGRLLPADGPVRQFLAPAEQVRGVQLADSARFSTGTPQLRLVAVHRVARYPLAVALIVPGEIFLAGWVRARAWIYGGALLIALLIVAAQVQIARSIRRRAGAERQLRDSETKFHTMVDWSTDWEYWLRPDGSVHYMTPSALAFTGHRVEDFVADPSLLERVIHPEDQPAWQRRQAQLHAQHEAPELPPLDLRLRHLDGTVRWVSHACRPVYDDRGSYLGRRSTMRDITERKAYEEEIRQLAYFDVLTGLPNRRLLHDRLHQAMNLGERSGSHAALALIDLDHFKRLNDTRGHDVGDRLLVEVAQRLSDHVRDTDTVARLGGDEFAVVLNTLDRRPEVAARQAASAIEHLRAALNQPCTLEPGMEHTCHASFGIALFRGRQLSIDSLFKQSDLALYRAKDSGRDALRFFNPEMQAAIDSRVGLEAALNEALRLSRFELHYQPQTDLHGRLVGAEALLRWNDPEHGLRLPQDFMAVAEDSGLIVPIGQWVLDEACAQLRRWQDEPLTRELTLAVNVSARQFRLADFADRVRQSLRHHGAPAARLKLELTETTLLENTEEVTASMRALRADGVRFSLDDFGTGYSSLSYLRRMPLDEIKVDRSFVDDIDHDVQAAALVQAVVSMGRSLGLAVIAEGVETAAQHAVLQRQNCWGCQGHLIGRPMPMAEWDWAALAGAAAAPPGR